MEKMQMKSKNMIKENMEKLCELFPGCLWRVWISMERYRKGLIWIT